MVPLSRGSTGWEGETWQSALFFPSSRIAPTWSRERQKRGSGFFSHTGKTWDWTWMQTAVAAIVKLSADSCNYPLEKYRGAIIHKVARYRCSEATHDGKCSLKSRLCFLSLSFIFIFFVSWLDVSKLREWGHGSTSHDLIPPKSRCQ